MNRMAHDYSYEELKEQLKKLTSTPSPLLDKDITPLCIQKEKSLECLAENSSYDSQFSYNLFTNRVMSYIEQGGKVRSVGKSIDGYTFLMQKLEMIPNKEHQKHLICLMIEVLRLMRDPSQQLFRADFSFRAIVQMRANDVMMPFCTRMKIISRNAQQRPAMLLFEQSLCPELTKVMDDKLLFRMFSITGSYNAKSFSKLKSSLQCLLTENELKRVMEDMSDLSEKEMKEIEIVEKIANHLSTDLKKGRKSYSYRARIENKTTIHTYGFFKIVFRLLMM